MSAHQSGTASNPGIIPKSISDIFSYIRSHPSKEFLLRASYIEIYNESLKDLLCPETQGQIKVRQDEKKRFFVSPLREEVVTTEQQVAQLLKRGETNRMVGQTDYNSRSSRSHTVFQIVRSIVRQRGPSLAEMIIFVMCGRSSSLVMLIRCLLDDLKLLHTLPAGSASTTVTTGQSSAVGFL